MAIEYKIKQLRSELEIMQAVNTLEYHNKNYLSGDNKSRCETKASDLKDAIRLIDEIGDLVPNASVTK